MSTSEDEELLEQNRPGRVARYADDPADDLRPVRHRPFDGLPRRARRDRQLPWGPALAAVAAGFAIAIVFGPCRSTDSRRGGDEDLAKLEGELQSARDRAAQLESELSASNRGAGEADAPEHSAKPERRAKADASESRAQSDASERKQPTEPAPKRESRSELTPEEVLRMEPVANAEPAKETAEAAKEAEPSPITPTPVSNPSPNPSRIEPELVALVEPRKVAAASVYDVSDSAGPVVRATSRSGAAGVGELQALTPERAGWTTEAQPTLDWHASEGTQFPCEFKLVREGQDEPLVRVQLPAPRAAGIQRIELSQFGVSLDEGASYRWSVSLVDLEDSGADRAIGGIRRVAPPDTLRAITDAAAVPEHLDALERAGLWYDALDLVTRLIERNPGAETLVARRNAMLAKVGIRLQSS